MYNKSASGYGGLENTPLARIGYHDKIIANGYEDDFLGLIVNDRIVDGRVMTCNQVVQFQRQARVGPWKPYEKNQELVADQVSPESFCMRLCESAYKDIKFDNLDIAQACERWNSFESGFLDDAYQELSGAWRQYALTGMHLEASPHNKGVQAGRACDINLGTINNPIAITPANFARELAKLKRALMEAHRWVEGRMFIVIPPVIQELLVETPYANAMNLGSCADCSILVTGQLPGKIMGFDVFVTNDVPSAVDPGTGDVAYYIIAGDKEAFAFVGDIIEGRLMHPTNYFGVRYQMLAVWGGKAITPDALAVAYWAI